VRIEPTSIPGVFVVDLEPVVDDRGVFVRTFCAEDFESAGLVPAVAQCSLSSNPTRGTLRGMHFQQAPYGEAKLVRCSRGRIFDVAVDARSGSSTLGRWQAWELDARSYRSVFLPPGVAHGFLTLTDDAEVTYQMSASYRPDASAGFRWDDPAVGIAWPSTPSLISDRDRHLPLLADAPFQGVSA